MNKKERENLQANISSSGFAGQCHLFNTGRTVWYIKWVRNDSGMQVNEIYCPRAADFGAPSPYYDVWTVVK